MPMLNDLYWLAGIVEGEGCFYIRRCTQTRASGKRYVYHRPYVMVNMTDKDVVQRAADIFGNACSSSGKCKSGKQKWGTGCQGVNTLYWMQTLYPIMGTRRRTKIRELVSRFGKFGGD